MGRPAEAGSWPRCSACLLWLKVGRSGRTMEVVKPSAWLRSSRCEGECVGESQTRSDGRCHRCGPKLRPRSWASFSGGSSWWSRCKGSRESVRDGDSFVVLDLKCRSGHRPDRPLGSYHQTKTLQRAGGEERSGPSAPFRRFDLNKNKKRLPLPVLQNINTS